MPPLTCGLMPGRHLPGRLLVELAWLRERLRGALLLPLLAPLGLTERQIIRHVAARSGRPSAGSLRRVRTFGAGLDLPEIVLCPAALDFPRPPEPRLHFTGPGVLTDRHEAAFDWDFTRTGRPLIYCALGTLSSRYTGHRAVLQAVLDAVADMPEVDLLMAVGEHLDPASFGPLPSRMKLARHVPQIAALRRATVFVTHGGMNSIKESIVCGVPMLLVPSPMADAPGNAARVVWLGLGLRVSPRRATAVSIRRGLDRLLHDGTFRERVSAMRDLFLAEEERVPAARVLGDILAASSTSSEVPPP